MQNLAEFLAELKPGDRVTYCWRGSASCHYPRPAKVLRRGKTFIEIEIEGYSSPTIVAADGMRRWHDTAYYAFISPKERLQEEVERSNDRRRSFNLTAEEYGLKKMAIASDRHYQLNWGELEPNHSHL